MPEDNTRPPGITGVITSIADDLRSSPGLLVLALVNLLVLAMVFIATRDAISRRDKQFMFVLERCAALPSK